MLYKKLRVPVNSPQNLLIPAIKVKAVPKAKESIGRKIRVRGIEKGQNHQREAERSTQDLGKRRG